MRRTSVTRVAIKMQDAGVISYTRGIIKIVDLQKLTEITCECYETLHDEMPNCSFSVFFFILAERQSIPNSNAKRRDRRQIAGRVQSAASSFEATNSLKRMKWPSCPTT